MGYGLVWSQSCRAWSTGIGVQVVGGWMTARCRGILFVVKTGIRWGPVPRDGLWVGLTCGRRLRDWNQAGVWERLHNVLLGELQDAGSWTGQGR